MKYSYVLLTIALFLIASGCLPARSRAEEQQLVFLRALQDGGYADMAVDYLRALHNQPDKMTAQLAEVWDFELSKSLLAASKQTFYPQEAKKLMQEAETALTKFLKENPHHSETDDAQMYWGEVLQERALRHLHTAQTTEDSALKKKEFETVRKRLIQAREPFNNATKTIDAQLTAMPKVTLTRASSQKDLDLAAQYHQLELNWVNAVFHVALIDYYTALTYPKPKNEERLKLFKQAIKRFDYLWQTHRLTANMEINPIGLLAHMWHGRILDEMGDKQTAADIYDEVLASEPDSVKMQRTNLDPLFAQVEYFRFLIARKDSPDTFLANAVAWLNNHNNRYRFHTTDGYQGLALEVAKLLLTPAKKTDTTDRSKATSQAIGILKDMVRVRSEYQEEAILLLRKHSGDVQVDVSQISTFDEAVTVGNSLSASHKWQEAAKAYQQALDLAEKSSGKVSKQQISAVYSQLATAQLGRADALINTDKLNEALDLTCKLTDELVQKNRDNIMASRVAAAAVQIALAIYANAAPEQKGAKLDQLQKQATRVIDLWPQRPEADDARLALGHAQQLMGNADKAMEVFESIEPHVERYSVGQFMAGRLNWIRYLNDKRGNATQQQQASQERAQAIKQLQTSLDLILRAKQTNPATADAKYLSEIQVLLAEAALEENAPEHAVKILKPMVAELQAHRPERLDNVTLRVFLAAVRAYVAMGYLEKANEAGTVLLSLGPDLPPVNGTLIEFARMVEMKIKTHEGELIRLKTEKKYKLAQKTQAQIDNLRKMLGTMLENLAQRKQLGVGGMLYVADTYLFLDMNQESAQQYQAILDRYNTDEEFKKSAAQAISRVYAQSITVQQRKGDSLHKQAEQQHQRAEQLRSRGKANQAKDAEAQAAQSHDEARQAYQAARQAAESLITKYPRSLEPRMEKARVLQLIAAETPATYDDAINEWAALRNILQPMRTKPPAYYEATLGLATCLVNQGEFLQTNQKLLDAQKLLKATLIMNSHLDGPDTVARFEALLKRIADRLTGEMKKP